MARGTMHSRDDGISLCSNVVCGVLIVLDFTENINYADLNKSDFSRTVFSMGYTIRSLEAVRPGSASDRI
jgi:hypothetical protein